MLTRSYSNFSLSFNKYIGVYTIHIFVHLTPFVNIVN